jgi:hypothetical protein
MIRSSKLALVAVVAGSIVMMSVSVASAQASASKETNDGYGYEFDDDPLNAGGFGPNDATIKVRAKAARTMLIRPRKSFVPEMLKSVENI